MVRPRQATRTRRFADVHSSQTRKGRPVPASGGELQDGRAQAPAGVLYVGPYADVEQALVQLPRRIAEARSQAEQGVTDLTARYRRLLDTMTPEAFADQHGEVYLKACSRIDAHEREAVDLERKLGRIHALVASHPSLLRGAQQEEAGDPAHIGAEMEEA